MTHANETVHACDLCVFRDRDSGGNGNCPLRRKDESWSAHKATWPDGCASWKVGDLRRRPAPAPVTEALF